MSVQTRRQMILGAGLLIGQAAGSWPAPAGDVTRAMLTALPAADLAAYAAALPAAMRRYPHPAMFAAAAPAGATPWDRAHLRRFDAVLQAIDPPRTARLRVPIVPLGAPLPAAFSDPDSPLHVGRSPEPLLWSHHAWIDLLWQRWHAAGANVPAGHAPRLWLAGDGAEIRLCRCPAGDTGAA